jgi:hypothetical protein
MKLPPSIAAPNPKTVQAFHPAAFWFWSFPAVLEPELELELHRTLMPGRSSEGRVGLTVADADTDAAAAAAADTDFAANKSLGTLWAERMATPTLLLHFAIFQARMCRFFF